MSLTWVKFIMCAKLYRRVRDAIRHGLLSRVCSEGRTSGTDMAINNLLKMQVLCVLTLCCHLACHNMLGEKPITLLKTSLAFLKTCVKSYRSYH